MDLNIWAEDTGIKSKIRRERQRLQTTIFMTEGVSNKENMECLRDKDSDCLVN